MSTFTVVCPCGEITSVQAETRKDAIAKMKEVWPKDKVKTHMEEKHQKDSVLSPGQVYAMIEQKTAMTA